MILPNLHVLDMYIVSITIGDVDNDDLMTRDVFHPTSLHLTCGFFMRAKEFGKGRMLPEWPRSSMSFLGDFRQIA